MSPTTALSQIIAAIENGHPPLPSPSAGTNSIRPLPQTASTRDGGPAIHESLLTAPSPAPILSPPHTLALSLSRVGTPSQLIRAGTLASLLRLGLNSSSASHEAAEEEQDYYADDDKQPESEKKAEASLNAKEDSAFGEPLHSLVVVGRHVHPMEIEYAAQWAVDPREWWSVAEERYGVTRKLEA
jgi:diphthine synthase